MVSFSIGDEDIGKVRISSLERRVTALEERAQLLAMIATSYDSGTGSASPFAWTGRPQPKNLSRKFLTSKAAIMVNQTFPVLKSIFDTRYFSSSRLTGTQKFTTRTVAEEYDGGVTFRTYTVEQLEDGTICCSDVAQRKTTVTSPPTPTSESYDANRYLGRLLIRDLYARKN
jgi:hypothetical protein